MNGKLIHWLAIGLLLATGVAGTILCVLALSFFESARTGGLLLSTSPSTVAGAGIVLLALATRIGLEIVDLSARRRTRVPAIEPHGPIH
jgi:hypothetical protein